jgi:integrase
MRVSDIRNLRFENLLWEQERIEINQTKSSEPLALPLTEDIGNALIDHLRYGRPASHLREIFLRANAPFIPFGDNNNLHYIITRYRRRAAIKLPAALIAPYYGKPSFRGRRIIRNYFRSYGTSFHGYDADLYKNQRRSSSNSRP